MSEETIFARALEKASPEQRAAYLDEACAGNSQLRQRIEALLAAHEAAGGLLDVPAADEYGFTHSYGITEGPNTVIGPYKLLQQIGEGGFGVVYEAEQKEPVKRRVALKIIKPGMDTAEVVARFEGERQALALMDHENIARVLDGGATETGRPYFVMDLVAGVPITDYCDRRHLTPPQRLELFIPVCQAVQHAHQKGVIHRDIKPSNVLVTLQNDRPVPKVIDFGVAKAMSQRLTEKTVFTRYGQIIGTLQYMSPEQAEMSRIDIDTRSDIYSLGVLLYELLTGTTPLDPQKLHQAAFSEMQRMLREDEPPKPSTRISETGEALSSIAACRRTEPRKLGKLLKGDLDWIVMKALEKDRSRRYQTANGFAMDIKRYLADEPVLAGPPSVSYKLRKFARRNKNLLTTVTAVAALLVLATLLSTWLAIRATQAEALARRRLVAERKAKQETETQRDLARALARKNQHLLYLSDMKVALEAWQSHSNISRVLELLQRHLPTAEQQDLRGFEWYYLWRLCDRSLMTPNLPHKGFFVTYSHDGQYLAAGGAQYSVEVWNLPDRKKVLTLSGHSAIVQSAAFSPSGRLLATASEDKTVRLWDLARADESPRILRGHTGRVYSVAYSPDGTLVASGSEDKSIRRWSTATGEQLLEPLQGHAGTVYALAFSPDGSMLASGGHDASIRIWDAATGQELQTIPESHGDAVFSVAFSPTSSLLASGSRDRTVKLWNPATGEVLPGLPRQLYNGHQDDVKSVAYSRDGRRLASGSEDNTVKVWDVATGDLLETLQGHGDIVRSVAFSPDAATLASAGRDDTIKLWDVSRNRLPSALRGHDRAVRSVAFGSDAETLVTGGEDGSVMLWNLATGESTVASARPGKSIFCVAVSSDQGMIAYGFENEIGLIDRTSNEVAHFEAHDGDVYCVAFSHDGRTLLSGGADKKVNSWDVASGQLIKVLDGHEGGVRDVALNASGETLASGADDRTVRFWDFSTGKLLRTLRGHQNQVTSVGWTPDGGTLASTSRDGTVRLWDVGTGQQRATLQGHSGVVYCSAFSPDGETLATGGYDRAVNLWEVKTGALKITFHGNQESVSSLAFSPDGKTLAAGFYDRGIRLWRAASREEVLAASHNSAVGGE